MAGCKSEVREALTYPGLIGLTENTAQLSPALLSLCLNFSRENIYKNKVEFLSLLTSSEEVKGLRLDLRSQLLGFIQIFQYVDVGSKKDHVLLPTAIGHMEKILCVFYG